MKNSILCFCVFLSSISYAQTIPQVYQDLERSYEQQDFQACVNFVNEIESLAADHRDTLTVNSFFYIGDAYYQLGQLETAIQWFEREKELRSAIGMANTEAFSGTLYNLAFLHLQAGNFSEAGLLVGELLENDRKLYGPTSEEYIFSVISAADIYIRLDRINDAEKLLVSAIRQQPKEDLSRGVLLSELADIYTYTSRFTMAERTLEDAIEIISNTAGEGSSEFITASINRGILQLESGRLAEAEETFDYVMSEITPDEPAFVATLNNQGLVYHGLGQLERAEEIFEKIRSLDSVVLGTGHPDFAITLTNLGFVYCDEGKYLEAEAVLRKAIEIQRNNGEENTASYARKLNNLARVYRLSGKAEEAIKLHEQALKIFNKVIGKRSAESATTFYNSGLAHWQTGDRKKALKLLKSSADIRGTTLGKEHPKYAESVQKIAELQWEGGDISGARESFGAVFENYYHQLHRIFPALTEEEKAKFYYTRIRPSFEKFNSLALQLHTEDPSVIGEIYDHHINTKGSIMHATERVRAAIEQSGDTTLIQQYHLWKAQKEQIAKLYSENKALTAIDSLQTSADQLEKELARKSSVFATQLVRPRVTWRAIRDKLKPGEAAVEVLRFRTFAPNAKEQFKEDVVYAFLIVRSDTKEQPDIIIIENGADLEGKMLSFYRNSIRFRLVDERSYATYIDPLAAYCSDNAINTIYFSADGVYNQVNIGGMRNPSNGKFIIDTFDLRYVTNTRDLLEKDLASSHKQSSILIGFPRFNLEEKAAEQTRTTRSLTRGAHLTRGLRGGLLRHMRGEGGIATLPGTEREIEEIAAVVQAPDILMAAQASESAIKRVNSPGVLHVATHGYFLEESNTPLAEQSQVYVPNPLLKSGLILAGAENFLLTGIPIDEEGNDGVLTAYEAMNLDLDKTDLVVLSACETGLGVVRNGEGVYGLQRAFRIAGARNLIMSLWSVDDDATQQLMTTFYQERSKGHDNGEAFRIAQQKLKEKYPHPFYWAAFVLVGI